jgi:hypothetical protein
MTTTTAFILGIITALIVFMVVPIMIGLAIRYLAQEELDPTDDATGYHQDAPNDACWGRWAEIACPECGRHIAGPVTDHDHHPTRIFELCHKCEIIRQLNHTQSTPSTRSTIVHPVHH